MTVSEETVVRRVYDPPPAPRPRDRPPPTVDEEGNPVDAEMPEEVPLPEKDELIDAIKAKREEETATMDAATEVLQAEGVHTVTVRSKLAMCLLLHAARCAVRAGESRSAVLTALATQLSVGVARQQRSALHGSVRLHCTVACAARQHRLAALHGSLSVFCRSMLRSRSRLSHSSCGVPLTSTRAAGLLCSPPQSQSLAYVGRADLRSAHSSYAAAPLLWPL